MTLSEIFNEARTKSVSKALIKKTLPTGWGEVEVRQHKDRAGNLLGTDFKAYKDIAYDVFGSEEEMADMLDGNSRLSKRYKEKYGVSNYEEYLTYIAKERAKEQDELSKTVKKLQTLDGVTSVESGLGDKSAYIVVFTKPSK